MAGIATRTFVSTAGETVIIRSARPDDAAALLAYARSVAAETPFFITQEPAYLRMSAGSPSM
jgi:hypothetical protein